MIRKMTRRILPALLCLPVLTACADASASGTAELSAPESSAAVTSAPETTAAETSGASAQFPVTDAFAYTAGAPECISESDICKEYYFYRDGLKIYGQLYLPEGDGPFPVTVISSGQTASYTYYADEAAYFAENGCACLIFDFTGAVARSRSDGELQDSSVLTEAADLNAVLDSLPQIPQLDTAHVFLFGHSLGGLVSTYVGCSRPEDISGIMLIEPSFAYPDFARAQDPDLSQVPDVIYDSAKYNTVVGRQFVVDMQSVDIFSMMPQCDKDVLIFLGTENCLGTSYPEYFERAVKSFPSAEIVTVQGADHFFQGEYGEQAAARCAEYIKSHI